MRFRAYAAISVAFALILSAGGFGSAVAADPSPTGRTPKFLWTPERQAVWNQMRADFESDPQTPSTLGGKWYKLVKENAECGCRYGDTGQWATFMYQWTGEQRYVDLAWTQLSKFIALPSAKTGGNYIREYGIQHVVALDWLWPGLSARRREELTRAIALMLDHELNGNPFVRGLRMVDSDQVVGTYFAAVLFYLMNPADARAAETFRHPHIGGLDATGADLSTARNAIKVYVEQLAEGGEWIESGEYNLGTVNLLLLGSEAVRTATGKDHFPEVTRWIPHWARRQMAFWTPDLSQTYQWGDEEHPREARLFAWMNASGLAAGLLQSTSAGAQLQRHLQDLVAKYGAVGSGSAEPAVTGRMFFTFNPYAASSEWRSTTAFHAKGVGLLLHRSDVADSLFAAHVAPRPNRQAVDHSVRYLNDFELWRKGEWVITHPRGYSGAPNGGNGTNAVLMHGFGDMPEFKELVAAETGDVFAYQAGTTGGAAVSLPYYDPPPVFVHEWTRSVLYVTGETDTVVVFDRAHVTDLLRPDRYYPRDQALFQKAPAAKQWILHMPVAPTIASSAITWTTPNGQSVRWSPILPASSVKRIYDESALRRAGDQAWVASIQPSELKYHVKMWPAVKKDWDTFLNVVQVGDPGDVDLVTAPGEIEGVRVSRRGAADVLAVFNAQPSTRLDEAAYHPSHEQALRQARVRSSGYTLRWTAVAETTDLYLADLDRTQKWSVEVDGRIFLPVTTGSSGLLRLTVTGSGTRTLTVRAAGSREAASPTQPSSPDGLRIIR